MKTAKLILLCLSGMLAMQSATAQSRSEKKAQTERNVREAINADHYKINVDYMQPMKGRSRALTSDYSIEIRKINMNTALLSILTVRPTYISSR